MQSRFAAAADGRGELVVQAIYVHTCTSAAAAAVSSHMDVVYVLVDCNKAKQARPGQDGRNQLYLISLTQRELTKIEVKLEKSLFFFCTL